MLTGAAGANVFLGAESTATLSVTVVQEFEVSCSDPKINQVVMTLESNLLGFIRAKHKASACVRLASATLVPAGWSSTPYSVCYPASCVGGPHDCCSGPWGYKYETPQSPVPVPPMPLGRYVLQANFIISASASGCSCATRRRSSSPRAKRRRLGAAEHDPFKGDKHDDFGFAVTVKADSPPGVPAVTHKKPVKRLASRNRTNRRPVTGLQRVAPLAAPLGLASPIQAEADCGASLCRTRSRSSAFMLSGLLMRDRRACCWKAPVATTRRVRSAR